MKSILIVYPSMMVGGSTTSLLSILNEIDSNEYCIDLLLLNTPGKLIDEVPKHVNIIPFAFETKNSKIYKLRKLLSIRSIINLFKGMYYEKLTGITNIRAQIMNQDTVRYCREIDKEYDIAISFLELWPLYYTNEKIRAKKKVAWIHLDYIESGLESKLDKPYMKNIDKFILVSESCKNAFDKKFPEYADKSEVIQNILSEKTIRNKALLNENTQIEIIYDKCIKLISVCRIVLYHKGLDRGVNAIKKLKDEGVNLENFVWFIIGDGPDFEKLNNIIKENGLSENIILLGEKSNPMPYIKQCDVFFLPSRYEGKPMAVTEAQMLGIVPIVTNYSSAHEQIEDGIDGIIVKNDEISIEKILRKVIMSPDLIKELHKNIVTKDYSNYDEINKIKDLLN